MTFLFRARGHATFDSWHGGSLRVGQHRLHRIHVGGMNLGDAAKLALVLRRLLGEDVALERHGALDTAAAAHANRTADAAVDDNIGDIGLDPQARGAEIRCWAPDGVPEISEGDDLARIVDGSCLGAARNGHGIVENDGEAAARYEPWSPLSSVKEPTICPRLLMPKASVLLAEGLERIV